MFKTACLSALASVTLAITSSLYYSKVALADEDSLYNSAQIDSREQELRRKEEELLRAMNLSASDTSQAQIDRAGATASLDPKQAAPPGATSAERESAAVTVLEVSAPGSTEKPSHAVEEALQSEARAPEALKQLEHHPALEPPKKASAAPIVTTNRVRTKTFDSSPDGTTARRLGSFYRIDTTATNSSTSGTAKHTRTVPIGEITPGEMLRPALLTSDDLATIRNGSTYLKTGPTRLDSTLLKVPQYSEVTIDYRSGAWYRVRTNNGVRGWVPGSALLFDADLNPRSTVRVGAVRQSSR